MTTNIYPGMPNADYHAHPSVGCSGLKLISARTPAHYWAQYLDPNRERREPTAAMKIGTAWHAAVFEPAEFETDYVQIPEGLDRRTKEGKALWQEMIDRNQEPLSFDDYAMVVEMMQSARSHPLAGLYLRHPMGQAEVSIFVDDVKIRPDFSIPPCIDFPNGLIIDGKTTDDASDEAFSNSCAKYGYHIQSAFYVDVWQKAYNTPDPPPFLFLIQEKDAPFLTRLIPASQRMMELGRIEYQPALDLYRECDETGVWPGYSDDGVEANVPAWKERRLTDSEEIEVSYAE